MGEERRTTARAAAGESGTSGARATAVLVVIGLATFMAFLDTTIVNVAFPAVAADFNDASRSALSWILNGYNIVFAALLVPAGRLADRYGPRRLFLFGLLSFTAASLMCALATSVEALVAFRTLQAVGAATLVPTALALLLTEYPLSRQITAIALLGAISGIAMATGPALGGALIEWRDWSVVFLINVPIGLAAALAAFAIVPRRVPSSQAQLPQVSGIVLITGTIGLLALGIVEGDEWGWGDPRIVGSLVASALLLVAFVAVSRRHPSPVIEFSLLRVREVAAANVCTIVFCVGLSAKLLCDVLFLTTGWGYSMVETGLAVSPSPIVTAMVARPAGSFAERRGPRAAAVPGGILYGIGCLWLLAATGAHPSYVTGFLPAAIFTGVGIALLLPTLTSSSVARLPRDRFAVGAGINSMARQLGAVVGVAAFVAIVGNPSPADAVGAYHRGWGFAALTSVLAGLGAVALVGRGAARTWPVVPEPSLQPTAQGERVGT